VKTLSSFNLRRDAGELATQRALAEHRAVTGCRACVARALDVMGRPKAAALG
jgi:hypothetical protein